MAFSYSARPRFPLPASNHSIPSIVVQLCLSSSIDIQRRPQSKIHLHSDCCVWNNSHGVPPSTPKTTSRMTTVWSKNAPLTVPYMEEDQIARSKGGKIARSKISDGAKSFSSNFSDLRFTLGSASLPYRMRPKSIAMCEASLGISDGFSLFTNSTGSSLGLSTSVEVVLDEESGN